MHDNLRAFVLTPPLAFQRRVHSPYGMEGGLSAEPGRNIWVKQPRREDGDLPLDPDGAVPPKPRIINIGGKASVMMGKGDRLIISTPGGGGWGPPTNSEEADQRTEDVLSAEWSARGSLVEREQLQASF